MEIMAYRPCGECRAYVPVDRGCRHWHGQRKITLSAARALAHRRRKADAAQAAREVRS